MTTIQEAKIQQHGQNLLAIFPNATEKDPVKLCKKLRALEARGNALALRLCNGPEYAEGEDEKITAAILANVNKLLGNVTTHNSENGDTRCRVPIFVNRDPRGHALKIDDEWLNAQRGNPSTVHKAAIHRDWGGYGILAPEIGPDGE